MNLSLIDIIILVIGLSYMFMQIGFIIHTMVTGREKPFTRRPPD